MRLNSISVIFSTSNIFLLCFFKSNLQKLIVHLKIPAHIAGPFFFMSKTRKFVMLKSIHIYKKAGISFAVKSYKFGLLLNKISSYRQVLYFIYFLSVLCPLGINLKVKYSFKRQKSLFIKKIKNNISATNKY